MQGHQDEKLTYIHDDMRHVNVWKMNDRHLKILFYVKEQNLKGSIVNCKILSIYKMNSRSYVLWHCNTLDNRNISKNSMFYNFLNLFHFYHSLKVIGISRKRSKWNLSDFNDILISWWPVFCLCSTNYGVSYHPWRMKCKMNPEQKWGTETSHAW